MSHKGQHPRDPKRRLATESQITENWKRTFKRKTRSQIDKENALILAGFADLYFRHDDRYHPEVSEYYRKYQHRKKIRVLFDKLVHTREKIKESESNKV